MKKIFLILIASSFLNSCNFINNDKQENLMSKKIKIEKIESQVTTFKLPKELLGKYEGNQPSFYLINKLGENVIINGNKIKIQETLNTIILKEGSTINMKQLGLESGLLTIYDGTFNITKSTNNEIIIESKLSNGKDSNITLLLTVNLPDKSIILNYSHSTDEPEGLLGPDFKLNYIK